MKNALQKTFLGIATGLLDGLDDIDDVFASPPPFYRAKHVWRRP
jgi:hypothetical protein